jgi:hypothetical protein
VDILVQKMHSRILVDFLLQAEVKYSYHSMKTVTFLLLVMNRYMLYCSAKVYIYISLTDIYNTYSYVYHRGSNKLTSTYFNATKTVTFPNWNYKVISGQSRNVKNQWLIFVFYWLENENHFHVLVIKFIVHTLMHWIILSWKHSIYLLIHWNALI